MTERVDIEIERGHVTYTHVPPLPTTWDDARHIVRHQLSEHSGRLDSHGVELGRLHGEQQNLHTLIAHNNNLLKHVSGLITDLAARANQASNVVGMIAFGLFISIAVSVVILWRIWPK